MRYSLPSRELISDSIETVMESMHYDALITVPGCDKKVGPVNRNHSYGPNNNEWEDPRRRSEHV